MRHPDYKEWMTKNNIDFDPVRPVKINYAMFKGEE